MWHEYLLITHLSLTQCLIEINLHAFSISVVSYLCFTRKHEKIEKNIRETIFMKSYHSLSSLLPLEFELILLVASYFTDKEHNFHNKIYIETVHTLRKPGWIVVDISERDIYCCWPWQPSNLPSHIFGLNDNRIMLSGFPVHVMQGSPDDSCGGKKTKERKVRISLL